MNNLFAKLEKSAIICSKYGENRKMVPKYQRRQTPHDLACLVN